MPSFVTPKRATAYETYVGLISQANTKLLQNSPTLAAGDVKVSIDNGAPANLTTLPVIGANTRAVKVNLSAAEMTGDNITVVFTDAAGAEWCDLLLNIQTSARQMDDLAFPLTSGRGQLVDAAGLVDATTVKLGPSGAATAQTARDVGNALPAAAPGAANGLVWNGTNAPIVWTGAGAAVSMISTSGNGQGLLCVGQGTGAGGGFVGGATNAHGVSTVGQGSGSGWFSTATGNGGYGALLQGFGVGAGFASLGGDNGHGGVFQGGSNVGVADTHGLYCQAGSGSGTGLRGQGCITNGSNNSIGIGGVGSVQGGAGGKFVALLATYAGFQAIGVGSGPGALFEGGTTGAGAGFLGGPTSGAGAIFAAQAGNSDGATFTKSGSGIDINGNLKAALTVTDLTTASVAPTGVPGATDSVVTMIARLHQALRNKLVVNSGTGKLEFYDAAGVLLWSKSLSDVAGVYTELAGA